jgi:arylsulfatase A-like enzyme
LQAAGAKPIETDGRDFQEGIALGGYDYVFSEGEGFVSVSDGRWKYVHVVKMGRQFAELYDLASDPLEFLNVIELPEHAAIVAVLRKQITDLFLKKLLA